MSAEWDTVTKIGSKTRGGASAAERERVLRGDAAINAARRSGAAIDTQKKFGGTNSVSSFSARSSKRSVLRLATGKAVPDVLAGPSPRLEQGM